MKKFDAVQSPEPETAGPMEPEASRVVLYTDGGCIRNPGPGGYGVVLRYGKQRKELSGGCRLTTNNRMEILACIMGLQALKRPCQVTLYSDSRYVVDSIEKGWARRWQARGWMRNAQDYAENPDLWEQLLNLCRQHWVKFHWTPGHAGNPDNERCDELAAQAARRNDLLPDEYYEQHKNSGANHRSNS